jgi:hypothetical protein
MGKTPLVLRLEWGQSLAMRVDAAGVLVLCVFAN